MLNLRSDLKFAFRILRNSPGFSALAVLTLGLGIASATTVFGWIDTVLLHPISGVRDPGQLVALEDFSPEGGRMGGFPHPDFRDYQRNLTQASGVIAAHSAFFTIGPVENPKRVVGQVVSANYFAVLGVQPLLGRMFLVDEDRDDRAAHPLAVVSERLWRSYFLSDPRLPGRTVRINGRKITIVGVAPPDFRGTLGGVALDIWVPLTMAVEVGSLNTWAAADRNARFLEVIARMKPGVTIDQASAQANSISGEIATAFPDTHRGHVARFVPMWKASYGLQSSLRNPLRVLMVVCLLVLLIACANVANLLMARSITRQREFAVRAALGAGCGRLVRLVLTEVLLLSSAGAVLALFLSLWMAEALPRLFPAMDPVLRSAMDPLLHAIPHPDTFLFATLLSIAAALLCALTPALFAGRISVNEVLKEGGRGRRTGGHAHRARAALVIVEVALAMTAVAGAGLAIRSFQRMASIQTGFDGNNVLVARLHLSANGYSLKQERQFCRDLRLRMASSAGVDSAVCADSVPLSLFKPPGERVHVEGAAAERDGVQWISRSVVSPGYFGLMRIPILQGRDFTDQDETGKPLVIIVNQTFARRYFHGMDPLGRQVRVSGNLSTIIGVVQDSKYNNPPEGPTPFFYGPFRQIFFSGHNHFFYVRARDMDVAAAVLRREVTAMDRSAAFYDANPLTQLTEWGLFAERIIAGLLTILGILSVALAALGLYSLMGYTISERTQEIGIRMALGAKPSEVFFLVVAKGLRMTLIGLAAGLAIAVISIKVASSVMNMPIHAEEPVIFAAAALFLTAIALMASWLLARRATRVEPAKTLRAE